MAKPFGVLVWTVALAALGLVLIMLIFPLLGLTPLVVQGRSMTPNIPDGSLVVVQPVQADRIGVGDVITYSYGGRWLTHRVVDLTSGGRPVFITRGDANSRDDGRPVEMAQVLGRVAWSVPMLGLGYTRLGAAMNVVLLMPLASLIMLQVLRMLGDGGLAPTA